jgi:hypothetical protein
VQEVLINCHQFVTQRGIEFRDNFGVAFHGH